MARDVRAARVWYDEEREGLGADFESGIEQVVQRIVDFNESFPIIHGDIRRASVRRFPYSVFYQLEPRRVVILRALHNARDPRLWPRAEG